MAGNARTVDIKLQFEAYDMVPGKGGRQFRRNLLLHGGKTDAHGFSYADVFLRIDAHAVQRGQPCLRRGQPAMLAVLVNAPDSLYPATRTNPP